MHSKNRPFLKWPGGKFRIMDRIIETLPKGKKLIEPFLGGGSVFLNTHYEAYTLNDINPDLINLYTTLKLEGSTFIDYASRYFTKKTNSEMHYYHLRDKFNHTLEGIDRSALFLYLNRHGYNGLCRYNLKGFFNVPFGRYQKPYYPKAEMVYFSDKSKLADFTCQSFEDSFKFVRKGSVIYCDPPYMPLSLTSNFTQYQKQRFGEESQSVLAQYAKRVSSRGVPVIISNHHIPKVLSLYDTATIIPFEVRRYISCVGSTRGKVMECLAVFD